MELYHGTWNEDLERIFDDGYLDCSLISSSTEDINNILIRFIGYNLRGKCVYLTNSLDATNGYDYALNIDSNDLNTNLLYVADNSTIQDIYNIIMSYDIDEKEDELRELSLKYEESFISYDEYIEDRSLYERTYYPEFLYFGDIPIKMDEEDKEYLRKIS